uniref:Uncharacterized protein n=1 Tax=Physcomitrium patens TaxID=3218 RepID=A0A2K1JTV0_PHYPA|nr:hypothetical protein PHYPA_014727 [Physcomitrium patens]
MCCKDHIIPFSEAVSTDIGGNLGLVLVVGSMKTGRVGKGTQCEFRSTSWIGLWVL